MGRRAKDWYPNQLNDRREQQAKRPIAAAPGSMVLADEYPPTTVPPLSSTNLGMSTSAPRRSRGAALGPSRVSRTRSNKSKVKRPRPDENLCMRVRRPESSGQPSHDIRVPRTLRHLCEPMIEDVFGLEVMTLSVPGDLNFILGPQEHTYVSGGATCHPCFDQAMLASSIDLPYRPGQHSLPHVRYGPTQAASDSPQTMPSYQPPPGADDGLWDDGMQSTN